MRCRTQAFVLLGVFTLCVLCPGHRPASAGLFSDVVDGIGEVAEGVGGFFGRGVGGFFGSASAPTVQNVEDAGRRLIEDADNRMADRIDQMSGEIGKQIEQFDAKLEQRICQIDSVAEKRIDQLDRVAGGRLDQLDSIAQKNIVLLSEATRNHIGVVDVVLASRIDQIDGVIASSIDRVDDLLSEKIERLDEISEQRIGNLDVVATKASLSFEASMVRIAGIACIMVFAACAVWRFYSVGYRNWTQSQDIKEWIERSWWPLSWQLGGAAACLAALWGLFAAIPSEAESQIASLCSLHEQGYASSFTTLDFRQATYHASQLQLISPGESKYRGYHLKASLVRDLFARPALRDSRAGVFDIALRIEQAERLLNATTSKDPDLEIAKAFLLWQSGPTRLQEYKAAAICASVLNTEFSNQSENQSPITTFVLADLALNYVENYLTNPLPDEVVKAKIEAPVTLSDLAAAAKLASDSGLTVASPSEHLTPLMHVFEYDRLVRNLHAEATHHYGEMMLSHFQWLASDRTSSEHKDNRTKHANIIVRLWQDFDTSIAENHKITGTTAPFALFTLNDVLYVRARWFAEISAVEKVPALDDVSATEREIKVIPFDSLLSEIDVPPSISDAAGGMLKDANEWKRAWFVPPRVAWSRRYLSQFSKKSQSVMFIELERDFEQHEVRVLAFEDLMKAFFDALNLDLKDPIVASGRGAMRGAEQLGLLNLGVDQDVMKAGLIPKSFAARVNSIMRDKVTDDAAEADVRGESYKEFSDELTAIRLVRRLRLL